MTSDLIEIHWNLEIHHMIMGLHTYFCTRPLCMPLLPVGCHRFLPEVWSLLSCPPGGAEDMGNTGPLVDIAMTTASLREPSV